MYLKAFLFLLAGTLAVAGLLLERPDPQTAFLLFIAIWSFCRLYYFMFYVVEKYIDGQYRFAGILDFVRYLWRTRAATTWFRWGKPRRPDRQSPGGAPPVDSEPPAVDQTGRDEPH